MPPRIKSIEDLRRELALREKQLGALLSLRAKIAAKLESLDRVIGQLGGAPAAARIGNAGRTAPRGRLAKGGKPLVDCIKDVLAKATGGMRVKEIEAAVTKAGYRSAAKDFYNIVASTLRNPKIFVCVKRGVYKLKG